MQLSGINFEGRKARTHQGSRVKALITSKIHNPLTSDTLHKASDAVKHTKSGVMKQINAIIHKL